MCIYFTQLNKIFMNNTEQQDNKNGINSELKTMWICPGIVILGTEEVESLFILGDPDTLYTS